MQVLLGEIPSDLSLGSPWTKLARGAEPLGDERGDVLEEIRGELGVVVPLLLLSLLLLPLLLPLLPPLLPLRSLTLLLTSP
jgi:hypothetical protein